MENTTIALIAAIAAVVSALFAGVSAYLAYRFKREDGKAELEKELNRILEIGVQYPCFEYAPFTNDWINHRGKDDETYLRYDIYCNMIYNFIHHVYEYYGGDKKKIENYVDVKSWIRMHKQNWQNPTDENENIDGYDEPFRQFINSYLI